MGKAILALVVVAGLTWGQFDGAADLEAEQAHYCDMVKQGAWPDYKDTYDESC